MHVVYKKITSKNNVYLIIEDNDIWYISSLNEMILRTLRVMEKNEIPYFLSNNIWFEEILNKNLLNSLSQNDNSLERFSEVKDFRKEGSRLLDIE